MGHRLLPVIALCLRLFPALGYIKKPNHLRAEDGWDDNRNFYAFRRRRGYWTNSPVKLVKDTTPKLVTCPTTVDPG
jgi:hypothetical protein